MRPSGSRGSESRDRVAACIIASCSDTKALLEARTKECAAGRVPGLRRRIREFRGFILIGSFTSHVTGSVGRLSNDLAQDNLRAALFAGFLVLAFFVGAFIASLILEGLAPQDVPRAYAVALFLEAVFLFGFVLIADLSRATNARILDGEAAILSAAMGMQNSLVTRLSGAVVRTTHLTGIVTDLGIELARWYRWRRAHVSGVLETRDR